MERKAFPQHWCPTEQSSNTRERQGVAFQYLLLKVLVPVYSCEYAGPARTFSKAGREQNSLKTNKQNKIFM